MNARKGVMREPRPRSFATIRGGATGNPFPVSISLYEADRSRGQASGGVFVFHLA
jgi:hypothetical protein